MRYIFLGVITFFIGLLIWASVKMGFYKSVYISEKQMPEYTMVYKEHIGPYHKMLPALEEVERWAASQKIDCSRSFGHFLDNPDVVEHERLKSHVGCLVDTLPETLPPDLKVKQIPAQTYFVAEFDGSPAIGPFKVYSKAKSEIASQGKSQAEDVIEIYHRLDHENMKTYFLFKSK